MLGVVVCKKNNTCNRMLAADFSQVVVVVVFGKKVTQRLVCPPDFTLINGGHGSNNCFY